MPNRRNAGPSLTRKRRIQRHHQQQSPANLLQEWLDGPVGRTMKFGQIRNRGRDTIDPNNLSWHSQTVFSPDSYGSLTDLLSNDGWTAAPGNTIEAFTFNKAIGTKQHVISGAHITLGNDDVVQTLSKRIYDITPVPVTARISVHAKVRAMMQMVLAEKTIPEVILSQLGGQAKLAMMIGAKNFVTNNTPSLHGKGSLTFDIPGRDNRLKCNKVQVRLRHDDTYDVYFYRLKGLDLGTLKKADSIQAESLKQVIESTLGIYLSTR